MPKYAKASHCVSKCVKACKSMSRYVRMFRNVSKHDKCVTVCQRYANLYVKVCPSMTNNQSMSRSVRVFQNIANCDAACQNILMYVNVTRSTSRQSMSKHVKRFRKTPEYLKVCQDKPMCVKVCQRMSEYARVCQSVSKYVPQHIKRSQSMSQYVTVC